MTNKVKTLKTNLNWDQVFSDPKVVERFTGEILPTYLQGCRWFAGKGARVKNYRLGDFLGVPTSQGLAYILIIEVVYAGGRSDTYSLPVSFLAKGSEIETPGAQLCQITLKTRSGMIIEATFSASFRNGLFKQIKERGKVNQENSQLIFQRGKILGKDDSLNRIRSRLLSVEQSNTTVVYNEKYFLKFYRRLFRDPNPDLELTQFLTEEAGFKNSPQYAGSISWKSKRIPEITIGLMQKKVDNQGEAWSSMLDLVKEFFNRLNKDQIDPEGIPQLGLHQPLELSQFPELLKDLIGQKTLKSIGKLGMRTAEMHIALASDRRNRVFSPTLFNEDYDGWLKNKLIAQFDVRHNLVELNLPKLEGRAKEYAVRFLDSKPLILERILEIDVLKLTSQRIRVHGDYHLGQVLITGDDFCILDFEGEPESSIRDRKIKQSPLKDVSGMLRSFHYAVYASIFAQSKRSHVELGPRFLAGERYYRGVAAIFLDQYVKTSMDRGLDIGYWKEINFLLQYHILEKAVYEIGYEINYRPNWLIIPLQGIMQILDNPE